LGVHVRDKGLEWAIEAHVARQRKVKDDNVNGSMSRFGPDSMPIEKRRKIAYNPRVKVKAGEEAEVEKGEDVKVEKGEDV